MFGSLATINCGAEELSSGSGHISGQVVVSGPLRQSAVSVDQLDYTAKAFAIRAHVGDVTTGDNGEFELDVGDYNGLLLLTAKGGKYDDLASGATIQLDPGDGLESIAPLELVESREDVLVSPIGHLVAARTRWRTAELGEELSKAERNAEDAIHGHFGGVNWSRIQLGGLNSSATSPTEPVRAALVHTALSFLVFDTAQAAGASTQEVTVLELAKQLAADLGNDPTATMPKQATFDGNDGNDPSFGVGLQLGVCAAVSGCVAPDGDPCAREACRSRCDLYAGTTRSVLAGQMTKVIRNPMLNQTGLVTGDILAVARAVADDGNPELYTSGLCSETLDRIVPTLAFGVTPADNDFVHGKVTVTITAIDDVDAPPSPAVELVGFPDTDGDARNNVATVVIDTVAATAATGDGPLQITAKATDTAGNTATLVRTLQVDNTVPLVTMDSSDLLVDATNVWWASTPGPTLRGTVNDAHLAKVEVMIGSRVVAPATITGSAWSAQLPTDALSASGNDVTIAATDLAGNVGTTVQTLRLDTSPPNVIVGVSEVFDEANSTWNYTADLRAEHVPHGSPVDMSNPASCSTIHKFVHLLSAPGPGGTHSVLGSSGSLNPLSMNVTLVDVGVGLAPETAQYRVRFNSGGTMTDLTPWTAMPATATAGGYKISLYRDGANAIPQLGTTNGEYHLEMRVADRFGRVATQDRCWNHIIMAPPLNMRENTGTRATGFQRALFSTKLNPGAGETGDFAAKLLNGGPAGAAVWRALFMNYLGEPVTVTVQIPSVVRADVSRQFKVVNGLTSFANVNQNCGTSHCALVASQVEYDSGFPAIRVNGIKFRARVFEWVGNETSGELSAIGANDATQTYVFQIPARTTGQGIPLKEYAALTYLRPEVPAGVSSVAAMIPSDANQPDGDPVPYSEFAFGTNTLTGKLIGPPTTGTVCVADEQGDDGRFRCIQRAKQQRYRALARIEYKIIDDVNTRYLMSATPALPQSIEYLGQLPNVASLATTEAAFP